MITTLMVASAVFSSLVTWFFAGRRQVADTLRYGALAPVWREGYLQGVADEEYADAVNFCHDGYGRVGPNRANPYRGSERGAGDA